MSRVEIPGFYFDSEKNRYFKITKAGQYSKTVIENAAKKDQSVKIDNLTIPKINNHSIIRQFDKKMRFKDDANFYSRANEIDKFKQFISLNNLHKMKKTEAATLHGDTKINYDMKAMLYDVENDNLITSSYDKIYISDGDNVRVNNSLSSDNVVYTPSRAMNGGINNLKLCHENDGGGGDSFLTFIQNSLNVNDDDLMICKLRNDVIFDHERIKVDDVRGGSGGDLSISNSKIAYTSKIGINVLDFQTVKQYAAYQHKNDIMTLDFQQNVIGVGDRNGGIFVIDIRCPVTNSVDNKLKMIKSIGKNSACCKFQFAPNNTMMNFLVNGTNDLMSLFDMRNTSRELIKYENYHIGDVINNPNVFLHDDYILAKDELSNVVKVYDLLHAKPLLQIGGGDHHNVNKFVSMKSLSEICILNTSNEVEYWCV